MPLPTLFTQVFAPISDLLIFTTLLIGFWLSLARLGTSTTARRRALIAAAIVGAVWYGAYAVFAIRGGFQISPDRKIPWLPIAVMIPTLLGLTAILTLPIVRRLLTVTPLSWLIGVQAYRVVGAMFVIEWAAGGLPAEFALPAGLGDILVGLLALPVASAVCAEASYAPALALLWNFLGLADFVSAMATGFLTAPGPFQALAHWHPNILGTAYPLAMIPVFLVPISIFLHALALRKLAMEGGNRSVASVDSGAPLEVSDIEARNYRTGGLLQ